MDRSWKLSHHEVIDAVKDKLDLPGIVKNFGEFEITVNGFPSHIGSSEITIDSVEIRLTSENFKKSLEESKK